jgi:hypothetical protein
VDVRKKKKQVKTQVKEGRTGREEILQDWQDVGVVDTCALFPHSGLRGGKTSEECSNMEG